MEPPVDSGSNMIRRSARISIRENLKQAQASVAVEHAPAVQGREGATVNRKSKPKPAHKRARHGSAECKAPKRAKGKLQIFMNIPLEIFIEIAKYLHPFDLVLLSRVNKFFRKLFMSQRAIRVWRSALLNVPGLPPCPTNICEPQYAALLFSRNCSMCGGGAPRRMDPVLLVRLCVDCRDKEAVEVHRVTDPTLVFGSRDLVPGNQGTYYTRWCLYSDARAVRMELDKLAAAGDQEATARWIEERRKVVTDRHESTNLLRRWLEARDEKHQDELDRLKNARQTKIKARLIEMGWEEVDICFFQSTRGAKWNALVYNRKPLGDKTWKKLLPQLLKYLDVARRQRLKEEKQKRRGDREDEFYSWIKELSGRFILAKAKLENNDPPQLEQSISTLESGLSGTKSGSSKNTRPIILKSLRPWFAAAAAWPGVEMLLEKDISTEALELELEGKRSQFGEALVNWIATAETRLAKMLPPDTQVPDFDGIPMPNAAVVPKFTLTTGAGDPINTLAMGTQKLLRADVVFKSKREKSPKTRFYPEHFNYYPLNAFVYYEEASQVAKALLNTLNWPDASYLELKALELAFCCGRCHTRHRYHRWEDLVEHYCREAERWSRNSKSPLIREKRDFKYAFTHDVNIVKPDRPLVQLMSGAQFPYHSGVKTCKLCQSVGLWCRIDEEFIINHVQDVHLVEAPEEGRHYN